MATLIDAAEYTSNEVYQIQATDPVEGAATGASFSGTGISNQPHQQLANRTAFLKQRQDVNISNIGILQAFMAKYPFIDAMAGLYSAPTGRVLQTIGSARITAARTISNFMELQRRLASCASINNQLSGDAKWSTRIASRALPSRPRAK